MTLCCFVRHAAPPGASERPVLLQNTQDSIEYARSAWSVTILNANQAAGLTAAIRMYHATWVWPAMCGSVLNCGRFVITDSAAVFKLRCSVQLPENYAAWINSTVKNVIVCCITLQLRYGTGIITFSCLICLYLFALIGSICTISMNPVFIALIIFLSLFVELSQTFYLVVKFFMHMLVTRCCIVFSAFCTGELLSGSKFAFRNIAGFYSAMRRMYNIRYALTA